MLKNKTLERSKEEEDEKVALVPKNDEPQKDGTANVHDEEKDCLIGNLKRSDRRHVTKRAQSTSGKNQH